MVPSFIDPLSIRKAYITSIASTGIVIHDLLTSYLISYRWYMVYAIARQYVTGATGSNVRVSYFSDYSTSNYQSADPGGFNNNASILGSVYYDLGVIPINYFGSGLSFRYDLPSGGTSHTCVSELVYGLTFDETKRLNKKQRNELYNSAKR